MLVGAGAGGAAAAPIARQVLQRRSERQGASGDEPLATAAVRVAEAVLVPASRAGRRGARR